MQLLPSQACVSNVREVQPSMSLHEASEGVLIALETLCDFALSSSK